MKYLVNIEIDLSDTEIIFLKEKFLNRRENVHNIFHEKSKSISNYYMDMKTLEEKSVIIVDNIGNSTLTQIGNKILDLFDRDIKISKLLNE